MREFHVSVLTNNRLIQNFAFSPDMLFTADYANYDSTNVSQIALEVAAGKLRPRLPESDVYPTGLIDLICRSWDAQPSNRPSFAIITSKLREIRQQIMQQGEQNL
jgi:hypothetical protein